MSIAREVQKIEVDFDGAAFVNGVDFLGGTIIAVEGETGLSAESVTVKPYSEDQSAYLDNDDTITVAADKYCALGSDAVKFAGLEVCRVEISGGESKSVWFYVAKVV
jgi:hypothetical protein